MHLKADCETSIAIVTLKGELYSQKSLWIATFLSFVAIYFFNFLGFFKQKILKSSLFSWNKHFSPTPPPPSVFSLHSRMDLAVSRAL